MPNSDTGDRSADPGFGFAGRIGRTLADSMPHWREPKRPAKGSPNVIVILFDDMGFGDLGCYGGEIQTPHIDSLASGGLRFTSYTTVPMCTPARAALLTGKNPHSVGCGWLTHNDPGYPGYKGEMSQDAPTMAELLRAAGYTTLAVGKWHNTYDANAQPGGDTSSWPMQRGFDRFYGFLGAETSYFHPDRMMEGNQPSQADEFPVDYFAPDDYTGRAIDWMAEHRSSSPDTPFFLYLAFQTPHTPLQGKPGDIAKYRGRYDAGWDLVRRERYERQRSMGLIEDTAGFSPRNPGVPAWDELSEAQRTLYARHMEVYAALVDNADQNVGRVLDFLRSTGQLDNTLILLTSDNGANSIGGPEGTLNLQGRRSRQAEDPALVQRLVREDKLGAADTYAAYPSGWTQVSNTPYRYYKRTPMAGGIRVPMVVHWPQGISDAGAMRRQWVHVTDLLPTVMAFNGIEYPSTFKGLRTRGLDGQSFATMFERGDAPQQRDRQYFELQANRGYISGVWKIVSLQAPRTPIQLDNWMLFNLEQDPAEINDLAAQHPDIVARLVTAFEQDASANYVYPLDSRDDLRAITVPPHELGQMGTSRDFLPGSHWVPSTVVSALIADRSYTLVARFDWHEGDDGVVLALGDPFSGMSLFVEDGQLHFVYQWWFSPVELAPIPLKAGEQIFILEYTALGGRRGQGRFTLNGHVCQEAAELSPTMVRVPSGGLTVGLNRRQPVTQRYAGRGVFRYAGKIQGVRITPGAQAPGTDMLIDEAAMQARIRAAAAAAAAAAR